MEYKGITWQISEDELKEIVKDVNETHEGVDAEYSEEDMKEFVSFIKDLTPFKMHLHANLCSAYTLFLMSKERNFEKPDDVLEEMSRQMRNEFE